MNKIVTILVAAMFFLVPATYSQTSLTISPTTITGNTGETVTVSLIVNDFTDIVSMQYGIKWDPAVIQYNSVDNFDLDLNAGNFNASTDDGFLSFSWFDNTTQGVSVPDGTTLFTMDFVVLGDASSGSTITFASRQGLAIEIASSTAGEITNAVTLTDAQFGDPNGNGNSNTGNTGNTDPLISNISNASGDNGTTVCVNVSVSNFTDITAMNYSLNWNASVLQFSEIRNINLAGLTQASFGTTDAANGQLSVNWANATGATASNGNIYQACFNLVGAAGTNSAVSFSSTPTPISVTTTASTTSVGLTQSNGTVSVNSVTPPPPPPVSSGNEFINIATVNTPVGSTVCVPITVNDFDGIASLQFSLQWNPAVLQFNELSNFNLPELGTSNFNATQAANGQLAAAWSDGTAQGVTLADGSTLFEICFTVLGADGTSSNIIFTDTPTRREAATADNIIAFTETNGSVTVGDGTPPPPPPPSTGGDALLNFPTLSAEVGSTVCLPVTVNDFNEIVSLQFSLAWNPAVLQFSEVRNFNLPELTEGGFNTNLTSDGRLPMTWIDNTTQGVTLQDGATIFEVCFVVVGAVNESSTVSFTDTPTPREAGSSNGIIDFTQTNSTVTVSSGSIDPPPPPSVGDALVNITPTQATAGSTVCIPVVVNDFTDITSLQFSLAWDPTVLQFTEIGSIGLDQLTAGNLNVDEAANGSIALAWLDNTTAGITLADGTTIFELCFNVIGTTGATTTIAFTDTPTPQVFSDLVDEMTFEGGSGQFTVGDGIVNPPPSVGDAIVNITPTESPAGSTVCIPVVVNDFTDITSLQFSLAWDPTVLQFTEVANLGLDQLTAGNLNLDQAANGSIALAWLDNTTAGVTLADGTTIFDLCFNVIGTTGATTTIAFTDTPTPQVFSNLVDEMSFEGGNGLFTVGDGTVNPPPPLGDAIVNITSTESPAGSTVCIPVVVNDFTDITSLQFSLEWDPTVLQFTEISNLSLDQLTVGNFNVDQAANGSLALAWLDNTTTGVTLSDGTAIFDLCFEVIGATGATTTIAFTDTPTPQVFSDLVDEMSFEGGNAQFTVGDGTVNPPTGGDLDKLVNIAPDTITSGESFCLPVTVHDFDAITAFQFSMGWNPAVLEFTGVQSFGVPLLNEGAYNLNGAANGAISVAWTDNTTQGVSLADGATLFEICFTAVGNDGTNTVIAFTDTPTPREAATTEVIPFTQTDGIINIGMVSECPGPIAAVAVPTNVTCNGMNDGAITLDVSGGDDNFTYTWSDATIGNIPNPTGLAAGVYSVTISSCGGQETKSDIATASLTITEPSAMTTVITPQNATCFGAADGRINVSISGGTLPYTYTWSDANLAPANRPVNVPAGTYTVTITDGTGCEDIMDNIIISSPTEVVASVEITPASCTGIADGTITLTTSGGSGGDYRYDWGGSGLEGAAPTGVLAGDYTVIITDGNNCTSELSVTVEVTVVVSGTVQVVEDACGDSNGGIQVMPNGGTGPYTYNWASGPIEIGDTNVVENVPTGNYSVTVTDANGCFYVENIAVGGPTAVLSASNTVVDVDCVDDANGSIRITAAGGFSPYTYNWSNDVTTPNNPDLTAGEYTVTITDSKVCTYIETFTIGTTSTLAVTVEITKGAPNATAVATVTGGVEPYTYEWCNGQTTPEATGLDEGNCSLTVIDALGCTIVENIEVVVDNPEVAISVSGEITCDGLADGILQAEGSGGKPGYTYAWNTGATTSVIANVGAGNYIVTVTDEVGNIGTATFDFTGPAPLVIDVTEQMDDCMTDGKICINIAGGMMPYKEIKWSNDVVDALCVEGLRSGDYGVIITDQNDCTKQENFRINPDPACIDCFTSIKVMTPNEDGRNDAFIMNCVDTAPNNHLEVYNRWGQLIFEIDDYRCISGDEADCWRGRTRNDRPVDEGGYFWVLEFDNADGTRNRIRDHVTILNDN
ncbi:MAG: cohesin domain-containing protein [Saprospiraceae bacterium]